MNDLTTEDTEATERATPETDDQPTINAINDNGYQVPCVDIEFARKLERERDELLAYLDAAHYATCNAELRRERDEAREERDIARLEAEEISQELANARKERDEACKHLAAANKGAEINAHINNSLTAKLAEAKRERDEAQKILYGIFRWIEQRHPDGFIDSLTHEQNLDRVYDRLYDRLDAAEEKLRKVLKLLDAYKESLK